MEVCESLRRERRLKLPCLSEAGDDGDAGLGDRPALLELPEHPPEQGLVVLQILVDASPGVAGAWLGAVQLVELDTAGRGQLLLSVRQSDNAGCRGGARLPYSDYITHLTTASPSASLLLIGLLLMLLLVLLLVLAEGVRSISSAQLTSNDGEH